MFVKSCWYLMLFAALVAAAGPVCAQGTEAGRFLSVVGDVRVGREGAPQRAAQRATEFYEGESIVTAAGALAQLRMTDGALMWCAAIPKSSSKGSLTRASRTATPAS